MKKTIELAVTEEVSEMLGSKNSVLRGNVLFRTFSLDSTDCFTKLGCWLIENIGTTNRQDDASQLCLVQPITNAGALLTNLGKAISCQTYPSGGHSYPSFPGYLLTDKAELDRAIKDIRLQLEFIEQQAFAFGESEFELRSTFYQWPIFGSTAGGWTLGVKSPVSFFDHCAGQLFASQAVVKWAGLDKAKLPEDIASKMHKGRGMELLSRHNPKAS